MSNSAHHRRRSCFTALTIVGLFFAVLAHIADGVPWNTALLSQLLRFQLWAVASPVIVWVAQRYPIGPAQRNQAIAVHAVASLLLSLAHTSIYVPLYWSLQSALRPLTLSDLSYRLSLGNGLLGIFIYGIVITVAHAIDYYRRYRDEELRSAHLETRLARAQLMALKMQLSPHFLFNTLNAISSLVLEDGRAARRMLARLGDFLRLTLEASGAQKVPLQNELDLVAAYLEIEKTRFESRLSVRFDVDSAALEAQVPNLILQPIVENAIKHGIGINASAGVLEIRARLLGDVLRIQVRDNGPGVDVSGRFDARRTPRVGLANTRERLRHLYHAQHRFEIATHPEGGVLVTVEIPFEPAEAGASKKSSFAL